MILLRLVIFEKFLGKKKVNPLSTANCLMLSMNNKTQNKDSEGWGCSRVANEIKEEIKR